MTRLTDKEREAVERGLSMKDWTGFDNQDQRDVFTLASCVTRLDAPVGGLETVGWRNPAYTHDFVSNADKESAINAGHAHPHKYSEALVLRSAAEAKIAGLAQVLEALVSRINQDSVDIDRFYGVENWPEVLNAEKMLRALIETDGGEG